MRRILDDVFLPSFVSFFAACPVVQPRAPTDVFRFSELMRGNLKNTATAVLPHIVYMACRGEGRSSVKKKHGCRVFCVCQTFDESTF